MIIIIDTIIDAIGTCLSIIIGEAHSKKRYLFVTILSIIVIVIGIIFVLYNVFGCTIRSESISNTKYANYTEIFKENSDINNDGTKEDVILYRNLTPGENSNIKLNVKDKSGLTICEKFLSETGLPEKMVIGKFTDPKSSNIFISINSGGSGADYFYWLLFYNDKNLSEIDLNSIDASKYINYLFEKNGIHFYLPELNYNTLIPLPKELKDYQDSKNPEIYYTPKWLEPVDVDNDGIYELKYTTLYQYSKNQIIASADIVFKYLNHQWKPISSEIKHDSE